MTVNPSTPVLNKMTSPIMPSSVDLLARAQEAGCNQSLLSGGVGLGSFEELASRVLVDWSGSSFKTTASQHGLRLREDLKVADALLFIKMADSNKVPDSDLKKNRILVYRRCVLLTVLGSTPESLVVNLIAKGYLNFVKSWLDDILSDSVGGNDLLLHLLSNIVNLPVTSDAIASSKIGKAVVGIKKHKICTSSAHEIEVKDLVNEVRDEWKSRVDRIRKTKKEDSKVVESTETAKRSREAERSSLKYSIPVSKKIKPSTVTKASSSHVMKASDLLQKNEKISKDLAAVSSNTRNEFSGTTSLKKSGKQITWADKSDVPLPLHVYSDGMSTETSTESCGNSIESVRYSEITSILAKLDEMGNNSRSKTLVQWQVPSLLPPPESPLPQILSEQLTEQIHRIVTVIPCGSYNADIGIPHVTALGNIPEVVNLTLALPVPFSNSVQAMQPVVAATSPPAVAPSPALSVPLMFPPAPAATAPIPALLTSPSTTASLEMVQGMGLPLFLIGSNLQALQTISANPNLLNTFRNAHDGQFDQMRLLSFVQLMSGNQESVSLPQAAVPLQNIYSNTSMNVPPAHMIGQNVAPPPFAAPPTINFSSNNYETNNRESGLMSKYRGDSNSDGNLHLSGYGPRTTKDDIVSIFAPYVRVDEVVMKSNFSFVNTSDSLGANLAREHLSGAFLGGSPIRINSAVRKAADPSHKESQLAKMSQIARQKVTPLPTNSLGQVDYDQVRDDRGNPATKNLFVAGYGPGTSENDLRDTFARIVTVVSVVKKNDKFAFVNTTDREAAVEARETLKGTVVQGGMLRINFAKESGRLGTSFDTTYGPSTNIGRYGTYSAH